MLHTDESGRCHFSAARLRGRSTVTLAGCDPSTLKGTYPPSGVALPHPPVARTKGAARRREMSDPADLQGEAPRKRGEAAWKADRDRIAARNERARKAGRARREAAERERAAARRERERREMAALVGKRAKP
jgi:hypothetical protein